MRTYDLSPLFRSSVGFDRISRLIEASVGAEGAAYPPYNIEKRDENAYRITMAVAGFAEGDLDLTVENNVLTIRGKNEAEPANTEFLYRGIAGRAFERRFQLADHVEVVGARLENGLLHVDLSRRIPDTLKPRKIDIGKGVQPQPTIEQKQAA